MMALRPELVHMENLPADTALWPLAVVGKDPRIYAGSQSGLETIDMHLERMTRILKDQLALIQME